MTDKYFDLHDWHKQLQRTLSDREVVEAIRYRRDAEGDYQTRQSLGFILASELREQDRYAEAEDVLLDLSQQDLTEPYPLISLAGQKLYSEYKPDEALEIIDHALDRARASGYFHRCALGVKARIAEKIQRYDLIADVIREIMTTGFAGNGVLIDVGIERDFVDRLPAETVDATLLQQFDEFCRRPSGRRPDDS
jgi:hypothetical protein